MKNPHILPAFFLVTLLAACATVTDSPQLSKGHIENTRDPGQDAVIPAPVTTSAALPLPEPEVPESVHTVVVSDVPIKELLFALTRDADLNLDIDEDITGKVTINAIDQPFSAILDRIVRSADLRYERVNNVLRVERDRPYLLNYRVDYLNITRNSETSVSVATEVGSTGRGGADSSGDSSGANNSSRTEVNSNSDNSFWNSLQTNIAAIISDTGSDKTADADKPEQEENTPAPNLVINKEAGIIAVRATQKQHRAVDEFLTEVLTSAQRQVLIEATIAEVRLNDSYQAGIDWTKIDVSGGLTQTISQAVSNTTLNGFSFSLADVGNGGDRLNLTLRALETFGDVSVVSSPKVMALNNQTALLKVVDNLVYFTIDVEVEPGQNGGNPTVAFESEVNTIPVGFVMTVTPFINESSAVTLNVRPTISRVIGQATDPNPDLARNGVTNQIPIVQVREIESVLKVNSGDVAVIGGLMQDQVNKSANSVPFLGRVPLVGPLFRYDDNRNTKTELVIFLKPVVINHASLNGDLSSYKRYLPKVQ